MTTTKTFKQRLVLSVNRAIKDNAVSYPYGKKVVEGKQDIPTLTHVVAKYCIIK